MAVSQMRSSSSTRRSPIPTRPLPLPQTNPTPRSHPAASSSITSSSPLVSPQRKAATPLSNSVTSATPLSNSAASATPQAAVRLQRQGPGQSLPRDRSGRRVTWADENGGPGLKEQPKPDSARVQPKSTSAREQSLALHGRNLHEAGSTPVRATAREQHLEVGEFLTRFLEMEDEEEELSFSLFKVPSEGNRPSLPSACQDEGPTGGDFPGFNTGHEASLYSGIPPEEFFLFSNHVSVSRERTRIPPPISSPLLVRNPSGRPGARQLDAIPITDWVQRTTPATRNAPRGTPSIPQQHPPTSSQEGGTPKSATPWTTSGRPCNPGRVGGGTPIAPQGLAAAAPKARQGWVRELVSRLNSGPGSLGGEGRLRRTQSRGNAGKEDAQAYLYAAGIPRSASTPNQKQGRQWYALGRPQGRALGQLGSRAKAGAGALAGQKQTATAKERVSALKGAERLPSTLVPERSAPGAPRTGSGSSESSTSSSSIGAVAFSLPLAKQHSGGTRSPIQNLARGRQGLLPYRGGALQEGQELKLLNSASFSETDTESLLSLKLSGNTSSSSSQSQDARSPPAERARSPHPGTPRMQGKSTPSGGGGGAGGSVSPLRTASLPPTLVHPRATSNSLSPLRTPSIKPPTQRRAQPLASNASLPGSWPPLAHPLGPIREGLLASPPTPSPMRRSPVSTSFGEDHRLLPSRGRNKVQRVVPFQVKTSVSPRRAASPMVPASSRYEQGTPSAPASPRAVPGRQGISSKHAWMMAPSSPRQSPVTLVAPALPSRESGGRSSLPSSPRYMQRTPLQPWVPLGAPVVDPKGAPCAGQLELAHSAKAVGSGGGMATRAPGLGGSDPELPKETSPSTGSSVATAGGGARADEGEVRRGKESTKPDSSATQAPEGAVVSGSQDADSSTGKFPSPRSKREMAVDTPKEASKTPDATVPSATEGMPSNVSLSRARSKSPGYSSSHFSNGDTLAVSNRGEYKTTGEKSEQGSKGLQAIPEGEREGEGSLLTPETPKWAPQAVEDAGTPDMKSEVLDVLPTLIAVEKEEKVSGAPGSHQEAPVLGQEASGAPTGNQEAPVLDQEASGAPTGNQEAPVLGQEASSAPTGNQKAPVLGQEASSAPTGNQEAPPPGQEASSAPTGKQEAPVLGLEASSAPTGNQEAPPLGLGSALRLRQRAPRSSGRSVRFLLEQASLPPLDVFPSQFRNLDSTSTLSLHGPSPLGRQSSNPEQQQPSLVLQAHSEYHGSPGPAMGDTETHEPGNNRGESEKPELTPADAMEAAPEPPCSNVPLHATQASRGLTEAELGVSSTMFAAAAFTALVEIESACAILPADSEAGAAPPDTLGVLLGDSFTGRTPELTLEALPMLSHRATPHAPVPSQDSTPEVREPSDSVLPAPTSTPSPRVSVLTPVLSGSDAITPCANAREESGGKGKSMSPREGTEKGERNMGKQEQPPQPDEGQRTKGQQERPKLERQPAVHLRYAKSLSASMLGCVPLPKPRELSSSVEDALRSTTGRNPDLSSIRDRLTGMGDSKVATQEAGKQPRASKSQVSALTRSQSSRVPFKTSTGPLLPLRSTPELPGEPFGNPVRHVGPTSEVEVGPTPALALQGRVASLRAALEASIREADEGQRRKRLGLRTTKVQEEGNGGGPATAGVPVVGERQVERGVYRRGWQHASEAEAERALTFLQSMEMDSLKKEGHNGNTDPSWGSASSSEDPDHDLAGLQDYVAKVVLAPFKGKTGATVTSPLGKGGSSLVHESSAWSVPPSDKGSGIGGAAGDASGQVSFDTELGSAPAEPQGTASPLAAHPPPPPPPPPPTASTQGAPAAVPLSAMPSQTGSTAGPEVGSSEAVVHPQGTPQDDTWSFLLPGSGAPAPMPVLIGTLSNESAVTSSSVVVGVPVVGLTQYLPLRPSFQQPILGTIPLCSTLSSVSTADSSHEAGSVYGTPSTTASQAEALMVHSSPAQPMFVLQPLGATLSTLSTGDSCQETQSLSGTSSTDSQPGFMLVHQPGNSLQGGQAMLNLPPCFLSLPFSPVLSLPNMNKCGCLHHQQQGQQPPPPPQQQQLEPLQATKLLQNQGQQDHQSHNSHQHQAYPVNSRQEASYWMMWPMACYPQWGSPSGFGIPSTPVTAPTSTNQEETAVAELSKVHNTETESEVHHPGAHTELRDGEKTREAQGGDRSHHVLRPFSPPLLKPLTSDEISWALE